MAFEYHSSLYIVIFMYRLTKLGVLKTIYIYIYIYSANIIQIQDKLIINYTIQI